MDITPQDNTQQPISDDQELAKALAGVMPDDPAADAADAPALDFEETPAPGAAAIIKPHEKSEDADDDKKEDEEKKEDEDEDLPTLPDLPALEPVEGIAPADDSAPLPNLADTSNLEGIKKDVLEQLRPLIGKVELPADEKFNVYLMLIRSTDDSSLIGPAHEAAQAITDEKVRAQALLDIIKEIDYFSHNQTSTTPSA